MPTTKENKTIKQYTFKEITILINSLKNFLPMLEEEAKKENASSIEIKQAKEQIYSLIADLSKMTETYIDHEKGQIALEVLDIAKKWISYKRK
jgi:hypothetical protein